MEKALVKHGNSKALVLDRTLLDLLELDEDEKVRIEVYGRKLVVSRASDRDERLEAALAEGDRLYGEMYKRLAE